MEKKEKKRDVIFKIIATMLVTIILINVNANMVSALSFQWGKEKELSTEEFSEMEKNANVDKNLKEREIIGEDISKRELNQKTFIMDDGTKIEEQLATLTKDNYEIKWRLIEDTTEENTIDENLNKPTNNNEELEINTEETELEKNTIKNVIEQNTIKSTRI